MISYALPFPTIAWFLKAQHSADRTAVIVKDAAYTKMTYRNRYYICGAQGRAMLNIPIRHGRNQRIPMDAVLIDNTVRWQDIHWKTLMSHYKRAPYYDYLAPGLQHLFTTKYDTLHAFNMDSISAVNNLLKQKIQIKETVLADLEQWIAHEDIRRSLHPKLSLPGVELPVYWQVFQDKMPFQPDLSILDYLFNEGILL